MEVANEVFPTHVGMNRSPPTCTVTLACVPHARGDEPPLATVMDAPAACSPRTWG